MRISLRSISDRKLGASSDAGVFGGPLVRLDYYDAEVLSMTDYYPFGMPLAGRSFESSTYRYGFNGKEKDNRVKGNGNHYNFGLRHFDPRIGRMFSMDPRSPEYPWQSPYVYHRNSPSSLIDHLGGGDPPKTQRNENGQVVSPNGYGADFAEDWYSVVEGNLVMTNGDDYQVWNPQTGLYEAGRAPRSYKGNSRTPYDKYPGNLQLGDTYEQHQYDPYGVNTAVGIFGDSRLLQYIGDSYWVILDDFSSVKSAEAVSWVFPIGGSAKSANAFLKWVGKFYAGKKVIRATRRWGKLYGKATDFDALRKSGIPKSPSNFRSNSEWGGHIDWGKTHAVARAKIGNITAKELEGLTKELAGQWYQYYKNIARLTPNNPSAAGRADLMKYIYDNFDKLIK